MTALPPSSSQSRKGYFTDAQGICLPSVTTILNATRPPEARAALARWRDRLGHEAATRVATTASRRGSGTHRQIYRHLKGEQIACPDSIRPYWNSMQPVLSEITDVKLLEDTVFHYGLGYAGKVDCVASFRGVPCVCDWKTADAPKGSVERLHDAPLQIAAYCGAVNYVLADQAFELQQGLVAIAIPNHPAEVFWFEPEEMLAYWQQWEQRLAEYYRRRRFLPRTRTL